VKAGPGGTRPRLVRIETRIRLLLVVAASAFIALLLLVQGGWERQVDLLLHERLQEANRVLERVLDLRASGAALHVDDYTRWDEFVRFTQEADPNWARINITESIATFNLDLAWVLDKQYNLIHASNLTDDSTLANLPIPATTLARALELNPIRHFFARDRRGLIEVWSSPIQPSDDFSRKAPVYGYYLAGRVWTAGRVAELARDADADVHVLPGWNSSPGPLVSTRDGKISLTKPLPGIDGAPVANVLFVISYPLISKVQDTLRASILLMVVSALLLSLTVGWALAHWVSRPLAAITEAVRHERPGLLHASATRRDEFGRLAELVEEFFAQRDLLIEAREATERAMATRSQFLANVSHELRTPMHGILSYSRFGIQESLTAEREVLLDDFRNIESCGTSLLALLDDLLDLAKLEAGRMRFEFEPIPLEQVVGEALDEFASFYHDKSLRVDVVAEGTLVPIVADHRKLLQVMRNLFSNAGKFSPPGGAIRVRMVTAEGRARVEVEDAGAGIPEGELEMIFDKFVQSSKNATQAGGTGLGLAICREIVGAHHGRVWAENMPGGGARFVVDLPIAGPADEAEPGAIPRGAPADARPDSAGEAA
jgi:signal transduction histidine kinase